MNNFHSDFSDSSRHGGDNFNGRHQSFSCDLFTNDEDLSDVSDLSDFENFYHSAKPWVEAVAVGQRDCDFDAEAL